MSRISGVVILALVLLGTPAGGAEKPRALRATNDAELTRALADARPGDAVVVADGTYGATLRISGSGTNGTPITVRAENPRKAVFSRRGQAARVDASYVRLEGLVFDSQYGDCTCVRITGRGVHVVDCEVRRPGSANGTGGGDGIQFFNSLDGLIDRCLIHHCLATRNGERQDSHGVRFTRSRDMTVRRCVIDLISGDCVQVDPNRQEWDNVLIEGCTLSGGKVAADDPYPHPGFPAGTYTSENAVDTKCPGTGRPRIAIRDCDVFGFRGPIGNAAAFNIKEQCEAAIDRCTIRDSEIGLRLRGPARVRVTNCVLFNNDTHCRYEDHIPLLHIAHCTFGRTTGNGHGPFQEQRPSPDLRVRGCLFLGETPRQAGGPSNRAVGTPAFVAAATGDYRLTAAVLLPGKGPAEADSELRVDRAGEIRPADQPSNAGAYEYRPR